MAESFAAHTGKPLRWYYAVDTRKGRPVSPDLKEYLLDLHVGKTNYRLGRLPLVIGMPVIIGSNYDVPAGIVNGSKGYLRKVRFWVDENGDRHLVSCVVECPHLRDFQRLPNLGENEVPVIEDTVSM
ncbi:hypothetical protein EV360DRAFT_37659, partial [Lentinula raphanica]